MATGHSWGEPEWTWTGTTSAAATFTCANNSNHTHDETATGEAITSATGTGANDGYTVYTATVSYNNHTYTDTTRTPITYTITYDHAGGTVATDNPTSYTVETETFTLNNPTRSGYSFTGWTWADNSEPTKTVTIAKGSTGDRAYTANWEESHGATFTNSANLAHVDSYLYRVGNGNAVTLGTLFSTEDTPNSADVKIKVNGVETNSSVYTEPTRGIEAGSTANCTYTVTASDWKASTLKFTGEGPVSVEIWENTGEHYTLNLEVVTGNNFTAGATLNGNANIVLLGNVKVGASSGTNPALYLNGKKLYGNGYEIDVTGSNISSMGHGMISLTNSSIDNAVIIGPKFTTYQGSYNNNYYGSTVLSEGGTNYISNCRITGASSPLRIKSTAYVSNTILSGGLLGNMEIKSGSVIVENLTTVNTQNSLGIVFSADCTTGSITINGTLNQHNFVADNASMSNTYANTLKNAMFNSSYSKYQFTSGGRKYVNTGIVSMSSSVGASSIIDNRADKRNYSGMTASLAGQDGYVYTMENTDSSMLETSYSEPAYVPSTQIPYEPVFSWVVPSGDNVAAGGDNHCYKDAYGVLQIQFLTGGSKTINTADYATFTKYGGTESIAPTSITCAKKSSGATVTMSGTSVTFNEAGEYVITYQYNGVPVYDKDLGTTTTANYTKTILVNVAVKKVAPNAVITVTQTNGTMIWGSAGSGFDPDYIPAAQIFDYMTITDYDDDGNAYTVLDGSNQASFLNNISSVVADSDNKTGFTINFPDGTKLVIKCAAPYNSGTLQFKKYNNKFLMCGSKAYNNPTAATWNVTSYTYTGRNGVAVTYGKRGFTSTTTSTSYSLSNLSSNKFLMFDAQGGTVSPSYTGTSPATLPTPTREGYTFQNWNTKADGTGTARNAGDSMTFSSSTTLYAIWAKNVTVSFSSEETIVSTVSGGAGTSSTLPSLTHAVSWLEGWYTAEEGGTKIGNAGDSFTMPSADTTYYAHLSPKYTVIYNANGGTVSPDSFVYTGTALTLPTPTNGSKTFEGWFTAAEGGTKVGTGGDSYVPTADIELFAQWSDNILVTFNGNGGTAGTNSATYDHVTPITLPNATRTNYRFDGWYSAADGGDLIGVAGANYEPTEPITLYAHWTTYTVTFNANSGSVSPANAICAPGSSITLPTPTRTGYTFNGWYTASSGGTKVGNAGASYTPSSSCTIYAQWTIKTYTVTIIAGSNGSVSQTSIANVPYNTTVSTNGNKLTINGTTVTATANSNYSFDSWSNVPSKITDNVTITANFKSSSSSCIPSGTMITMADGTKKPVEEVTVDDEVLVFNHETGCFDTAGIIFFEADEIDDYSIVNLEFSDGSVTRLIYEHGYFDLDLMEYVYIREDNFEDFIGHSFVKVTEDGGVYGTESVTLTDAYVTVETTGCFSFPSVYHLNFIADGFLSMPGGINGMFNIFAYGADLKYDEDAKAADIAEYGLLDYSFFEDYMTYEEYSQYPAQYLSVSLGKGLMTPEWLEYLIDRYVADKREP